MVMNLWLCKTKYNFIWKKVSFEVISPKCRQLRKAHWHFSIIIIIDFDGNAP